MKRNLPVQTAVFPMPTLMIGTYNSDGSEDVMMMAWGGICDTDMVALNLEAAHRTVANLKERMAFTLAVPGTDTVAASDYLGIVSANEDPAKFRKSGLHAVRSEKVDAPVIEEYPLTMECRVVEFQNQPYGLRVLGKIVGVVADESVLDADGNVNAAELHAFVFDTFRNHYYAIGEPVGKAWDAGADLTQK